MKTPAQATESFRTPLLIRWLQANGMNFYGSCRATNSAPAFLHDATKLYRWKAGVKESSKVILITENYSLSPATNVPPEPRASSQW